MENLDNIERRREFLRKQIRMCKEILDDIERRSEYFSEQIRMCNGRRREFLREEIRMCKSIKKPRIRKALSLFEKGLLQMAKEGQGSVKKKARIM